MIDQEHRAIARDDYINVSGQATHALMVRIRIPETEYASTALAIWFRCGGVASSALKSRMALKDAFFSKYGLRYLVQPQIPCFSPYSFVYSREMMACSANYAQMSIKEPLNLISWVRKLPGTDASGVSTGTFFPNTTFQVRNQLDRV